MKGFISTKTYGFLNYVVALLMISSLWTFGTLKVGGAALFLPLLMGWLQLIQAIFAKNEMGFIKQFPMVMHNVGDVIMGSFLFCSPWVYGFHDKMVAPQLIFGAYLVIVGCFTKGSPFVNPQHEEDFGISHNA
ncbi:SPW repeat domain-containing protein [Mucilaginibacter celer]|uniref:SPW repeat-containing integral membrane domain-containing protein n=1 Tax=Mucilaginibacter celer TaxID=2305508 RepID=A0A494VYG5_9SPHI|nr:SPW repeat protein [Mucilaginibacter celer]AYL99171.1 hypothetical protein HYN43_029595 [Mucilaginibacter celer]